MRLTSFLRVALLPMAMVIAMPLAATTGDGESAADSGLEPQRNSGSAALTLRARLSPAHPGVGVNVTIDVIARGRGGAAAAAFHVVYDPSLLEPVPSLFREGAWLRRGGARTSFLATAASTGERVIVGVARLAPARGVRKGGTVCRLVFKTLASGSTALALDRAHVTSADGHELALRLPAIRLTIRPAPRRP